MAEKPLPDAIDLSHHISEISKRRGESPLKGLQRWMGQPDIIMMAGGMPNPDYFPFAKLSAEGLVPESFPVKGSTKTSALSWFWNLFSSQRPEKTVPVSVSKYPEHSGDLNLATLLQYGQAKGGPQLQAILKEYTQKVLRPAYGNWINLIHVGNTCGYSTAFQTFVNPGEGVIVTEWTYPSALASLIPYEVNIVPIGQDSEQGMSAVALRELLEGWDSEARGFPRPRLIYTVPIGQNPTGATMGLERKKEIYAIAVEFDLLIVEDDPYYILQHGPYVPKADRTRLSAATDSDEEFLNTLEPSYLRIDYQGRVIRIDTFSKTIAPGCRMGWFTVNPLFAERLERQTETTTQGPSGFAQAMVTALLLEWGYEGYIRWLRGLRLQYAQRRDNFIDLVGEGFDLRASLASSDARSYQRGSVVYYAYPKSTVWTEKWSRGDSSNPFFSFVPSTSGMFLWIRVHFEDHPSFASRGYKYLEEKLFIALGDNKLLIGPGFYFAAKEATDDTPGDGHFRISYSDADYETMKKAVEIMSRTFSQFFKELQ
ncbi:pyridoxal phosphate-dependent transferase [Flagelloscypha sp. PMI_526]|nr:pyridoxal phosphate-dependent transferase [Flagelloscypha sp. PMI_526]